MNRHSSCATTGRIWSLAGCRRRVRRANCDAARSDADYETVAGFVLDSLHRLPEVGETFDHGPWRFEVVDLDGRRIDKLLVSRAA